jgi:hypothetical protein
MKISEMQQVSSLVDSDVGPIVRNRSNYKVMYKTIRDYCWNGFGEEVNGMATTTTVSDADIQPLVKSGTAYKVTMKTIADYIYGKFAQWVRSLTALPTTDISSDDVVPIVTSSSPRKTTITTLASSIFSLAVRPRYCCGSFETNGRTQVAVTFPYRLSGVPIVVCNQIGNHTNTMYIAKVEPNTTTATGFTATVVKQTGGETTGNDTTSLVVNYIAIVKEA